MRGCVARRRSLNPVSWVRCSYIFYIFDLEIHSLDKKVNNMAKILVVDDEPELRSDLEWAARGERREVIAAESVEHAIKLIQQHCFDVIVSDLRMEGDTIGLDVLRAAKKKDVYTQVIVVTAYGTPEISVKAMQLGAFDYLERNAPGTDHLSMVSRKIDMALKFREARVNVSIQDS